MATIFLSYRRTDSPQACRVYDRLVQRFGHEAVFMDVAAIPFAVSFPDFIKEAIAGSKVLIALIGSQWGSRIHQADDPVRMEIETALARQIPVLPVLIGSAAMPTAEELPPSIASIAAQNALVVGVTHDFHTHMQVLIPKIEAILGSLAREIATSDPNVIHGACQAIIDFLHANSPFPYMEWTLVSAGELNTQGRFRTTLLLHRVVRLAELLELHFILSFWARDPATEQQLAGCVLNQLEQHPTIPDEFLQGMYRGPLYDLRVRPSDEDPRQIWKMITTDPLRLSLSYIATVSDRPARVNETRSASAAAGQSAN